MKLTLFILMISFVHLSASVYSQQTKLNVNLKNASVREVLKYIEDQSEFFFLYTNEDIDVNRKVSVNVKDEGVESILDQVFNGTDVSYLVSERQIVLINRGKEQGSSQSQQSKTLTGKVTDSSGAPLPGVTVVVKGTTNGTITDTKGNYSLSNVPSDAMLIFSFVGMKSQEITVAGKTSINVTMAEETIGLEEVVAVGYGKIKKKDLTGAVSSVDGKSLEAIPVSTISEALSGRMAGVHVTTTEGSPDSEVKIRIRGGGSITQDNSPLYIVDGFPTSTISDIAPSEIQSIDVLKDASSTAIYGSRGANGVIIITTKSIKEGRFSVDYNGSSGFKKVIGELQVLNPFQFATFQYEMAALGDKIKENYEPYLGSYKDVGLYNYVEGTNWQDLVFGRTGINQNHNISISGGNKAVNFNITYIHIEDKAIMLKSDYIRDNISFKLNSSPFDWLSLNALVRYSDTKVNGAGANDVDGIEKSTSDSRLKNSVVYTPIPLQNVTEENDEEEYLGDLFDPLTQISDNERFKEDRRLTMNGGLNIIPIKGLNIQSSISIGNQFSEDNRYFGLTTYFVRNGNATYKNAPAINLLNSTSRTFRNTNTISYDFSTLLNNDYKINLLLGHEKIFSIGGKSIENDIQNFPIFFDANKAWAFTTEGTAISTTQRYNTDDKLISFFGRLTSDIKDRYLFSASLRADGSSKFAPGNRWGYFPSVAAAWRISEEGFMAGAKRWINNLKLRLSYGTAGNNRIAALAYMQTYSSKATSFLPPSLGTSYWSAGSRMSNPELKWETTVTENIGIDFNVLNSRFDGTLEMYNNETKDLLIDFPISGSGYGSQLRNIGSTSNKGIEFSLNSAIIRGKDFHLNFSFNISKNINKVLSLGGLNEMTANAKWTSTTEASNDYKVYVGQSLGLMYGFVTDGWYTENDFTWDGASWILNEGLPDNSSITGKTWGPGALKLKDLDNNGIIENSDRTIIGNANPKHTGGVNLNAQYKGFDLSANFYWVYGNDLYNANRIELTSGLYSYRNVLSVMAPGKYYTRMNYETGELITDAATLGEMNKDATIWAPVAGRYLFHSWAVEDGSFLKFNNLTFGYTIPKSLTSKIYIQNMRIYVTALNIYTWTNYSGFDPEVDTRRKTPLTPGVDYSAYPKSRTFNVGVNLTF